MGAKEKVDGKLLEQAWTSYNHRDELHRAVDQIDKIKDDNQTLVRELDLVIPVVEAACAYVDACRERHQVPVSSERLIRTQAELFVAVMTYQCDLQ